MAACVDATSYLGLGEVFPANMTGNTVLLALDLATGDHAAFARSVVALGAYVAGAVAAAVPTPDQGWTRTVRWTLAGELVLLGALGAVWNVHGPGPHGGLRLGLVALAGVAMGAQSGAVRRLQVPAVSTTYITGTWTSVGSAVGALLGRHEPEQRADEPSRRLPAAVVCCYFLGALAAALTFRAWDAVTVGIPVVVLLAVLGDAVVGHLRP